jgi:hypothetical protein
MRTILALACRLALACLLVATLSLGAGCGGATTTQLLHRASLDLRCPRDRLHVSGIDHRSRGVRGCGQRSVYVEQCNAQGCTWVLQSKHLD